MAIGKKKVSVFTSKKKTAKFDTSKIEAMIRDRAYYLWEEKGRPQGRDLDLWLQAKKDISAKRK